jgi:hypothetical protein
MVEAKRSVRNLFKRGEKNTKAQEPGAPRQGFMSGTRSSLAKVIRDSKSLSKVNLSIIKRTESRSDMRPRSSASKVSIGVPPVPAIPDTVRSSIPAVPVAREVPSVPGVKRQSILPVPKREAPSVPELRRQSVLSASEAREDPSVPEVRRQFVLYVPEVPSTSPPEEGTEAREVPSVPEVRRQSVLSIPEAPSAVPEEPSASPPDETTSARLDAAGGAVLSILRSIETLPRDSPERLRHMEIAEVSKQLQAHNVMLNKLLMVTNTKQAVINAAQLTRNAHVSAIEARMHAREAELHAQSAETELKHLQKLCEGVGFDSMSLKMIKALIKNAGLKVVEHELREIFEQDIREDVLAQNAAKAAGLQVPRT